MDQITTIGVDSGKTVFQVAMADRHGREVGQRRIRGRAAFDRFLSKLDPSVEVVFEVGPGVQHWARRSQALGHRTRQLPAQRVGDHRSGHKNDSRDASAVLRCACDPSVHAVPIKTPAQLSLQAMHRARQGWCKRRTALSNQMRGLLSEFGLVAPRGDHGLDGLLARVLGGHEPCVPDALRELLADLEAERSALELRKRPIDALLERMAREDPWTRRLMTIPGIGPVTATALLCKDIVPERFRSSRYFAAYFGVVPRQHSSADKIRIGKMSRNGDRYVCSLLIEGAHAVIRQLRPDDPRPDRQRLLRWKARHGAKGAAVRLANRNLRIIWRLLLDSTEYRAAIERMSQ